MAELYKKPTSKHHVCEYCGNKGALCQDFRYRRYCLKAVYCYLVSSERPSSARSQPWNGVNPDSVSGVFIQAYNEKRRVDIEDHFGFYNPNWMELPRCIRKLSYQDALNLAGKTNLMDLVKACNENGFKNYCNAKRRNKA